MNIQQRTSGNSLVVEILDKRLDMRAAPDFKESLSKLVESGQSRVVLDLRSVEFIDSSGLGALLSVLKRVEGKGDLVLFGLRPTIKSMFQLTRLDRVFRTFADEAEALRALS